MKRRNRTQPRLEQCIVSIKCKNFRKRKLARTNTPFKANLMNELFAHSVHSTPCVSVCIHNRTEIKFSNEIHRRTSPVNNTLSMLFLCSSRARWHAQIQQGRKQAALVERTTQPKSSTMKLVDAADSVWLGHIFYK